MRVGAAAFFSGADVSSSDVDEKSSNAAPRKCGAGLFHIGVAVFFSGVDVLNAGVDEKSSGAASWRCEDGVLGRKLSSGRGPSGVRKLSGPLERRPPVRITKGSEVTVSLGIGGMRSHLRTVIASACVGRIDIPDKDDRHVVAAAITCGAQKVLTWNLGDFPNQVLAAFGIFAESPDKFLSELIIDNPMAVVAVFKGVRERFKAPPMSVDTFFDSSKNNRLDLTAKQLARYHDLM